ncbi:MAG: SurA N-terminal domain-containing protein [Treponema sp.]|nr:SurA N-terminal domain-containing protein [Treponema sp.]MBQ2553406.1 SurA N-terminal domain-containing protein [Treponema sp.]MBQ4236675.1 SurA N-terminal domain-containing protein [Treponema sp.]MBQ5383504.1 SurA N-terminal domain-containing protein [Treponema sp.]
MKRFALGIALSLALVTSVFAQSGDMTPLAVVKLNKTETITLKQLKTRVGLLEKQVGQKTTVEQRKQLLDSLIQEKLVLQAAAKQGLAITDSQVDQAFLSTFSQQLGQQVTEAQLSELIKAQTGKSLNDYLLATTGMGLKESKEYLKTQLIAQQYVYGMKQAEISKIAATDSEIRSQFDMNRSQFVWNDMVKLFLVVVPKGSNASTAQATAKDLRNQYVKDKSKENSIKASADNGKKYQAGNLLVQKTTAQAQALGWTYANIEELFGNSEGYVSEVTETQTDYQFYAVQKKYAAKMLGISDIVMPESNVTVYEYIKSILTSNKQQQYFAQAAQDIAKGLDTPANVERKKTGDALNALLNW